MDSLLAGLVCSLAFGCSGVLRLPEESSDQTSPDSNCILIRASTWSSANGSTSSKYDWVLEKNGTSRGYVHFVPGAYDEGATTHYEFPYGAYEECLAKLEETRFFRMKSAYAEGVPSKAIGAPRATIEVHYHGRKHVVTQTGSAEIDDGFNKMWLFLGDVQKRSRIVDGKPGVHKRTLERMGGEISGLTPAGTLSAERNLPIHNN